MISTLKYRTIVEHEAKAHLNGTHGVGVGKRVSKLMFYRRSDAQQKWIAKLHAEHLEIASFTTLTFKELTEIRNTWQAQIHSSVNIVPVKTRH